MPELEQVIRDLVCQRLHTDDLILQDRVPGNDEYMRVLTSYSDRNGKVRMMCLGRKCCSRSISLTVSATTPVSSPSQ